MSLLCIILVFWRITGKSQLQVEKNTYEAATAVQIASFNSENNLPVTLSEPLLNLIKQELQKTAKKAVIWKWENKWEIKKSKLTGRSLFPTCFSHLLFSPLSFMKPPTGTFILTKDEA